MAIITRHGNEADFDPNRMRTAEFASFDDSGKIMHTQRPGVVRQLMTVQDAEAMIDEKIEPAVTRAEAAAESAEASAELANSSEVSAGASEEEAETNAGLSQSYAVGTGGVVREGDDTDNAKYYYEQARAIVDVDIATTEKAGIVKPDGVTISVEADGTIHSVVEGGVTGVKGASETEYRSGNVNITAENVGAYTTNAVDLSKAELQVLGWNVPNEMPIKNTLVNGVLTQNVGRVDLGGKLNWSIQTVAGGNRFNATISDKDNTTNLYSSEYVVNPSHTASSLVNGEMYAIGTTVYLLNNSYTSAETFKSGMSGKYLYYELATPITHTVSDTEGVGAFAKRNVRTNLLKPTLASTTVNGVTCTNNGDGTYTLNGTASASTWFHIEGTTHKAYDKSYKLAGCPTGGAANKYALAMRSAGSSPNQLDIGAGIVFNPVAGETYLAGIIVYNGTVCNNLVFKPMLTTDLTATYDDFIPYTGDTGTLNGDVAEIREEVTELNNEYISNKNYESYFNADTDRNNENSRCQAIVGAFVSNREGFFARAIRYNGGYYAMYLYTKIANNNWQVLEFSRNLGKLRLYELNPLTLTAIQTFELN